MCGVEPTSERDALRRIDYDLLSTLEGGAIPEADTPVQLHGVLNGIRGHVESGLARSADAASMRTGQLTYRVVIGWSRDLPDAFSYLADREEAEWAYRRQVDVARRFYGSTLAWEEEDLERVAVVDDTHDVPVYGWVLKSTRLFGSSGTLPRGPLLSMVELHHVLAGYADQPAKLD